MDGDMINSHSFLPLRLGKLDVFAKQTSFDLRPLKKAISCSCAVVSYSPYSILLVSK
jgi:hypothetical protein